MKCLLPACKRPRVESPQRAPAPPTDNLDLLADVASHAAQATPRQRHVPRLALDCLIPAHDESRSARLPSPIGVTLDGVACATERTLGHTLAAYHAHQRTKDIASQVDGIRHTQGYVRLVVGGERAPHEYRSPRGLFDFSTYAKSAAVHAASPARACELTLNSDATALPDLWGDVACSATMIRFEDSSFDAVVFECVPYSAFTCWGDLTLCDIFANHQTDLREGAAFRLWSTTSPTQYRMPRRGADTFSHLARVMRPGGVLEMFSGFPPEAPRRSMMQALSDTGFVVSYLETPQSPRAMGKWLGSRAPSLLVEKVVQGLAHGMILRAVRKPQARRRYL